MSAAVGRPSGSEVTDLIPHVRRFVSSRVDERHLVDDLVQETLARVLAASDRLDPGALEAYAIVTARNLIASNWQQQARHRRNLHRVMDPQSPTQPDQRMLELEESQALGKALDRLSNREREMLVAHEVAGRDTTSLAADVGSTKGAVAAQLSRARARLRVEYLLALEHVTLSMDRCRPVLLALSSGDRRRQREVGAAQHLLECELCGRLSQPLTDRRDPVDDEAHLPIRSDADIVLARQRGREISARAGFGSTDLTLIATAISEITRNIVRFAGSGQVAIRLLADQRPGVLVIARDDGPGIADIERALMGGYSTYGGLGLGVSGSRRLMDEFAIVSELGKGTTVTMTKWRKDG